jgi:hypothetical protein
MKRPIFYVNSFTSSVHKVYSYLCGSVCVCVCVWVSRTNTGVVYKAVWCNVVIVPCMYCIEGLCDCVQWVLHNWNKQAVRHSGWLREEQPSFGIRSTAQDIRPLLSNLNAYQSVYPIKHSPHCRTRYFFQFHSHNNLPPTNQYPFSSLNVTRSTTQITPNQNVLLRSTFNHISPTCCHFRIKCVFGSSKNEIMSVSTPYCCERTVGERVEWGRMRRVNRTE